VDGVKYSEAPKSVDKETGKVTWEFSLKPKETRKITLEFQVACPPTQELAGL